jgi:hypothetical protein
MIEGGRTSFLKKRSKKLLLILVRNEVHPLFALAGLRGA